MYLHDLIIADFERTKSFSGLIYLLSNGRELEFSLYGKKHFISCDKSSNETLFGKARLEEPYEIQNYIEFEVITRGHIKVKGNINNGYYGYYEYSQELFFENEFDQTYLRDFSKKLLDECNRFLGTIPK